MTDKMKAKTHIFLIMVYKSLVLILYLDLSLIQKNYYRILVYTVMKHNQYI